MILSTLMLSLLVSTDTESTNTFAVEPLPYAYDALEPALSAETLHLHHDKHYASYVQKTNELLHMGTHTGRTLEEIIRTAEEGPLYNNAAQAWNHAFYFAQFAPANKRQDSAPTGRLADAVRRDFGSPEALQHKIEEAATALFGSGWVWLVCNEQGDLRIWSGSNAANPLRHDLTPLLTIDVWEHAYYVDYRNRRADAVKALWLILDWSVISRRYK